MTSAARRVPKEVILPNCGAAVLEANILIISRRSCGRNPCAELPAHHEFKLVQENSRLHRNTLPRSFLQHRVQHASCKSLLEPARRVRETSARCRHQPCPGRSKTKFARWRRGRCSLQQRPQRLACWSSCLTGGSRGAAGTARRVCFVWCAAWALWRAALHTAVPQAPSARVPGRTAVWLLRELDLPGASTCTPASLTALCSWCKCHTQHWACSPYDAKDGPARLPVLSWTCYLLPVWFSWCGSAEHLFVQLTVVNSSQSFLHLC